MHTCLPLLCAGSTRLPFTQTAHPDVFLVQWAGASLAHLLRADLQLTQVAGMCLSVSVEGVGCLLMYTMNQCIMGYVPRPKTG